MSELNRLRVFGFMSAGQATLPLWTGSMGSGLGTNLASGLECRVQNVISTEAEERAIGALVEQYSGTLYRVAYSVLKNAADAEDAVQEAFVRMLRHRATLGEVRDARVWLVRIVWNVSLDKKRRQKTRPETDDVADVARMLPAAGLTPEQRASGMEHHRIVLRCLEQLPEREREVLTLSAFEELNSVEIAKVLGVTESSVRSRLFRARNLMAELLEHKRSTR